VKQFELKETLREKLMKVSAKKTNFLAWGVMGTYGLPTALTNVKQQQQLGEITIRQVSAAPTVARGLRENWLAIVFQEQVGFIRDRDNFTWRIKYGRYV
jgi:hypothetical protein